MDIFKLFFNHDLRLDQLAKRNANKSPGETEASLEDFMKPAPTYSKFYLTGTCLDEEAFGINTLDKFSQIIRQLDEVFGHYQFYTADKDLASFSEAIKIATIGEVILITSSDRPLINWLELKVDEESNVGHFKEKLADVLLDNHIILYKEQAHDGFDLHLFSKENIYGKLFYPLKALVDESFRFFSINSKRMGSERHFYFETWTLDHPPHGAEEVFQETVL